MMTFYVTPLRRSLVSSPAGGKTLLQQNPSALNS